MTKRSILSVIIGIVTMLCASCSDDEEIITPTAPMYEITYITSTKGLGDMGFSDNMMSTFLSVTDSLPLNRVYHKTPYDINDAKTIINQWILKRNQPGKKRLLVLESNEYDSLFHANPQWVRTDDDEIMIVNTNDTTHNVCTMTFPLYGVGYLTGLFSGRFHEEDMNSYAMLANRHDPEILECFEGFRKARKKTTSKEPLSLIVSPFPKNGYDNPHGLYTTFSLYSKLGMLDSIEFIFPICGYSATGMGVFSEIADIYRRQAPIYTLIDTDFDKAAISLTYFKFKTNLNKYFRTFIKMWILGEAYPHHGWHGMANEGFTIEYDDLIDHVTFVRKLHGDIRSHETIEKEVIRDLKQDIEESKQKETEYYGR